MKNLRFIMIMVLSMLYLAVKSQESLMDYHPFVEEGKTWTAQVGLIKENHYEYCIMGDTLIDGECCKKVYTWSYMEQNKRYYLALHEKGKKIYATARGSKKSRLLYDFGLTAGQTVKCGVESTSFCCLLEDGEQPDTLLGFAFTYNLRVEHIDTIVAHGMVHRRVTLSLLDSFKHPIVNGDKANFDNVIWVEGIGSGAGPFSSWLPLPSNGSLLLACTDNNNQTLFAYPDFYQNDGNVGIVDSRNFPTVFNGKYDLQGRRFSGQPRQSGVYIQDGRKVLK